MKKSKKRGSGSSSQTDSSTNNNNNNGNNSSTGNSNNTENSVAKKISWFEQLITNKSKTSQILERVRKVSVLSKIATTPRFLRPKKNVDTSLPKSSKKNNNADGSTPSSRHDKTSSWDKGTKKSKKGSAMEEAEGYTEKKRNWLFTIISPRKRATTTSSLPQQTLITAPVTPDHSPKSSPTSSASGTPEPNGKSPEDNKRHSRTSSLLNAHRRLSLRRNSQQASEKLQELLTSTGSSSSSSAGSNLLSELSPPEAIIISAVAEEKPTSSTHNADNEGRGSVNLEAGGGSVTSSLHEKKGSISLEEPLNPTSPPISSKMKSMNETQLRKRMTQNSKPLFTDRSDSLTFDEVKTTEIQKRGSTGSITTQALLDPVLPAIASADSKEVVMTGVSSLSGSPSTESSISTNSVDRQFTNLNSTTTQSVSPYNDDSVLLLEETPIPPESPSSKEDILSMYDKSKLLHEEETEGGSQREIQHAIHKAAWEGNLATLEKLIALNPQEYVDMQDPHDQTSALHKAAARNEHEIVKYLLEQGALVDRPNKENSTPLHFAAANGNVETIQVLCSFGAKIHIRDNNGYAPLHLCLKKSCFRGAEILVLYGGDINFKRVDGSTALHFAAETGDLNCVKWLLSKEKIMVNCRDNRGETPVLRAATHGRIQVVEYIMKNTSVQINLCDEKRQTMLHRAARYGYHDLLMLVAFLDAAACSTMLNEQDYDGRTPLHYAVMAGKFREVKALCTMGADTSIQDKHGDTVLHIAVRKKNEKVARFLYRSRSNADIKNKKGQTARQLAQIESIEF